MPHSILNKVPPLIEVLLAEDDRDDFMLFKKAIDYQVFRTHLIRVSNGDDVIDLLNDVNKPLPHVLFLDINLIGKNGYDCVIEMKDSPRMEKVPIVMYSSSYQVDVADTLYKMGVNYYIKKPPDFNKIKNLIQTALCFVTENRDYSPTRRNFLL